MSSFAAVQAEDNVTDGDAFTCADNETAEVDTLLSDEEGDTLSNATSDKNGTGITSDQDSIYYKGNYSIILNDTDANTTIANRTVSIVINNVNYTAVTDDNGTASVALALNPGKYTVFVCFSGDDSYAPSNMTSTLNILPTVKASDVTKYYKGSAKYTATFFTSSGGALANTYVKITVNGKTYSVKTNSKGVASIAVNLKPGTYKIIAADPVTGYKVTTSFKILSTISASGMQKFIGDGQKFKAKFYKSNGKVLAKKYIKFKLNGKTYKVKTSSYGWAKLSLAKLKKGTYNIVCYNKDGLKKTYKIQVYKGKKKTKITSYAYVFYQNQTKSIKAKFKTSIGGQSLKGKTVKIKINGKTYSKKTDADGMVYLTLPSLNNGLYKVSYTYAGAKYFKASSSTNYVTIINTKETDFTVKSTKSFGYGAGTSFKVLVSAGGVPLIKKSVTFTINGVEYTKTTDTKGIASVVISNAIGNYTVNFTTPATSKVNGKIGSCDINVFKRNATVTVWKSGSSFKDSLQTFKILVTDANGNPVSGATVQLKIDGETYTGTTASNGYATIKTEVALGKYKVSVKFVGNNNFLKSSTSKTVKVTLSMYKNGINEKKASASSYYLKSSNYCKVGTKALKKLVKKLTKGLTSKIDKAKALFNYVRDTLGYSYYYNSKYGSSKTLKYKKGNCVDHSNLLVAMYRTAGLKARYVHGKCTFDSQRTGHVWTQVLIDGKWVCGDATSYRNSLGKIKNWNTKTVTIKGKYRSIPF